MQSEVGPRKSSYGSGGALLATQQGPGRKEPRPKSNIWNTAITSANPGFYNGGSSQVIDQEFSKSGPSQGSGTKQN